tara:strand:- start:1603 stop:2601 length:999 start_codon:yes stop_codon:yes gene_type:complete
MNRIFPAALFAVTLASVLSPSHAQELSRSTFTKVRRAAVEIHIKGQLRGGGAFVRDNAGKTYVLTAAHLFLSPKDTCMVVTEDDVSHFGSLSAYNLGHDLALLEVPPEVSEYGALKIASTTPSETNPIYNLGPALRRRTLILSGNVADSRTCYTDFSSSKGYIAHFFAAGISPVLTSGGVWVNQSGEAVGVQHGRLIGDQGAPSSGLSMVSPPEAVARLLREKSLAKTPGIGGYVWEVWTGDRATLEKLPKGTKGLIVNPVFEGRPLARSGVKAFDVILSCDGKPVKRRHQLLSMIRSKPVRSTFTLEVITPGSHRRREVELTTDSLEEHWK